VRAPLRSVALVLTLFALAGCAGSDGGSTYAAAEVRDALRKHGFDVKVLSDEEQKNTYLDLLRLFSGGEEPDGVTDVVAKRRHSPGPGNQGGTNYLEIPPDHVVEAWIFDSDVTAGDETLACGEPDALTICLRKRNVLIIVGKNRTDDARAALKDLASAAAPS
jgi:hypothetical protein